MINGARTTATGSRNEDHPMGKPRLNMGRNVAEMWQNDTLKSRPLGYRMGIEWVSNGCRLWSENVKIHGQVRQKGTKLIKKPTPATPMRPLFEGGGVGFFSLNQWLMPRVLGDRCDFFTKFDT